MAISDAKTEVEPIDIGTFLAAVEPLNRQDEARQLVASFHEATGFPPRVWGSSIVGFGRYAYRYTSGYAGEAPATGFSPRKADLSIYITAGFAGRAPLLAQLGKHRVGKACLYLKRLSDADPAVLHQMIREGLEDLATRWTIMPD